MKSIQDWAGEIEKNIEKVFFGKKHVIEKLLVALLCRGHVLLEDVPGVGKTILARAFSVSLGGKFSRIQCTPDLLPADVLGVSIYNPKTSTFVFRRGPIISNVVLVDEINRATPRTQSALLEAMAEGQISVEGKRLSLPSPFILIATENPVEFEGTFPLPEAQKDRFYMSLNIGYPEREGESQIISSQQRITHPISDLQSVSTPEDVQAMQKQIFSVHVNESVKSYILDIVDRTREDTHFKLGVSPRGSLALFQSCQALAAIRGRDYIVPDDVKELAVPVCSKRVIMKSEYQIKGVTSEEVLDAIIESVPVPVLKDKA
ncbi:MAG: AAA family ATPase [Spirochaetia bacterium]